MKIVAISDTHNQHTKITIPECDILIHAGDATSMGRIWETQLFAKWLSVQPAKHIIFVPGNHELEFQRDLTRRLEEFKLDAPNVHILIDQTLELEGIKFYGSPQTPYFFDWAWNVKGSDIKKYWEDIPEDTDILITHGPPYSILDETENGTHVGCTYLYGRVFEVKPDLHIFGHIHHAHGEKHIDGVSFYNVSVCDEQYAPSQGITIIEF